MAETEKPELEAVAWRRSLGFAWPKEIPMPPPYYEATVFESTVVKDRKGWESLCPLPAAQALLAQRDEHIAELESRLARFSLSLRAADALARAVDAAVKNHYIDARSAIADARLDYGEPYKYEHTPNDSLSEQERSELLKEGS